MENKRVIVGVCVLFMVNIIWVLSSELTNFIFINEKYSKPFLTTYLKSSMFSLLLLGFAFSTHWRMLACPQKYYSSICFHIQNSDSDDNNINNLGEPTYVLINYDSDEENTHNPDDDYIMINHGETEDSQSNETSKRTVKFCKYKEVRHLSETYAEESLAARMSYNASKMLKKRIMIRKILEQGYYPATIVMKLAIQFCFCWFIASYAYQKSLTTTLPAVVNVISSTSSLFTLILASIFPSSEKDKFNITKLFVVLFSMAGVILINFSESLDGSNFHYEGIIWSLVGAIGYAIYLVNLRRSVKNEEQLSIPMFLGFVGLWTFIMLWPGFFILTWTEIEKFELPNIIQLGSVLLNGFLGTVGAELLWLWGCFLTSSLTATLSMGLTIPLSMIADYIIKKKVYNWIFYIGSIPILVSFFAIAYLTGNDGPSPDPIGNVFRYIFCRFNKETTKYEALTDSDSDTEVESLNQDSAPLISNHEQLLINKQETFYLPTSVSPKMKEEVKPEDLKTLLINECRAD